MEDGSSYTQTWLLTEPYRTTGVLVGVGVGVNVPVGVGVEVEVAVGVEVWVGVGVEVEVGAMIGWIILAFVIISNPRKIGIPIIAARASFIFDFRCWSRLSRKTLLLSEFNFSVGGPKN